jgi:hypothetical protein
VTRYTGGLLTSAGSTTLPLATLVGAATTRPRVLEIGMFNTTSTAVALRLCRLDGTSAGTPGTAAAAYLRHVPEDVAPVSAVRGTYTSTAPTVLSDAGYRCQLGAAVGSGCIWTFGDSGICVPAVANAALAILVENGTGQACQIYYTWDE